ncbi:MAG: CPBP family intramembrane glutamic endopeptidase [Thermodesulfobacteriota bacterium]
MDPRIELNTLALAMVAVAVVEAAAALAGQARLAPPLVLTGLIRLLETGLMLHITCSAVSGLAGLGLTRESLGPGLKKGLIWSAGFGLLAALGLLSARAADLDIKGLLQLRLPPRGWEIGLYFLVGGLVSPLAEEILFRGLIFGYCRRWGLAAALLASTLAFALAHLSAQQRVFAPVTQVIGGLVFGLAYERSRSLISPLIIHVLGNLAIFSLSFAFR